MEARRRMQNYRARLRQQGLRPIQIWVPDQRNPHFREELKRQVAGLNARDEKESLDFIEDVADWSEQ